MVDFDVGYGFATVHQTKSKAGTILLASVAGVFFLTFLIMNNFLPVFLFTALFAGINAAMRTYKYLVDETNFAIEIELTMFATVLMSMAYGVKAGIFTAIVMALTSDFVTGFNPETPTTVLWYVIAALMAPLFPASFFVGAGIIICIVTTIISWGFYHITESFSPFENFMYQFTDFAFNIYFFFALQWIARFFLPIA